MATAPTVPNFAQFNFVEGDRIAMITKQNGQNAALVAYGQGLQTFGEEIEQEQAAAIQTVETIRDNEVIPARDAAIAAAGESEDYRDQALQYRNEAQQIAAGDVAITDLQPGTLTTAKDYASTDGAGNVVKRNLADDVSEQLADFEPDAIAEGATAPDLRVGRYNATVYEITDSAAHTVDCSQYQGVYIDGGSPTITLTNIVQFPIAPIAGTSGQSIFTIVAQNTNAFSITNTIRWPNNDASPSLGDLNSVIALVFTADYQILGSVGHTS